MIVRFTSDWHPFDPGDVAIALHEITPDPDTDGGWIILGSTGAIVTNNGPGIYVDEFWEEL